MLLQRQSGIVNYHSSLKRGSIKIIPAQSSRKKIFAHKIQSDKYGIWKPSKSRLFILIVTIKISSVRVRHAWNQRQNGWIFSLSFCTHASMKYHACKCSMMYASFLKGQGHKGIFSLVKGTLLGNCKSILGHFKDTKAMTRGHGGNRLCCLHEVSVSTGAFQGHQGNDQREWGYGHRCLHEVSVSTGAF